MKIAQIVCAYPPYAGGIANSAAQLDRWFSARHEVVNFTPDTLKPVLRRGHGAFLPQLLYKLRGFDLIYLHYPFFGTAEVVWLFKKIFKGRPRLIIQYHMDVKNLTWAAKLLSLPSLAIRRSLLKQAETIVCGSLDYIKNSQIKDFYTRYPEKFTEIPFSVDLQKFQPRGLNQPGDNDLVSRAKSLARRARELFFKRDCLEIIFIGGLDKAHYFKGIDILLHSLPSLEGRKWRLKIVGDGDLRPDYENLAKRLELQKRVEFAGRLGQTELVRALQEADLLVLPSINRNEAFGIVLIEALACGVPVIASDLPGVRRVFTDGREGLLAQPGSVTDWNQKLEYIRNNEEKRREMGLAARRLAEKKYDERLIAKRYENLLDQ